MRLKDDMETLTRIIDESLCLPDEALAYRLSARLAQTFKDKFILETTDYSFDLTKFVEDGQCVASLMDLAHPHCEAEWDSENGFGEVSPENALLDVRWRGLRLRALRVTQECARRWCIIADTEEDARELFAAVCRHSSKVEGEILVYANGGWHRSRRLLESIAESRLENLILPDLVRAQLASDFEDFFESEELYASLEVAWKRGALLLGPPGNGKTHAVKAMVNRLGKPCLYVRSFVSYRGTVQQNIECVFAKARAVAPCILVLEDLDTLIDEKSRSYFLNQMDGFSANRGILTVATTNHPEKLDPAIRDRPSRFDRKITFGLPELPERRAFLAMLNDRRPLELRLGDEELGLVASRTEGFSFAYLKELCVSGAMAWMRERQPGTICQVMLSQTDALLAQMRTDAARPAEAPTEDEDQDVLVSLI